ncbi:MAG: hypothetical protein H7247_17800 [Polaromonas sp.]|nr:hypothetical protein [Gemmatimonadaceae bacterium]
MPRDDAPRSLSRTAATLGHLRALPVGLFTAVALVLASAAAPLSPLRDAATLGPVLEVTLQRPIGYVVLAPLSAVLDTLTLLSVHQHVAVVVTLLLGYALWWALFGRGIGAGLSAGRRAVRIAARIGVALVVLLGTYAAMAVMPRPMAALEAGTEILAVDFHAHTRFSHDGRSDWSPEDVRTWHRNAGFGAAYVSDHRTFEGARDGWSNNPRPVGEGTTLLPAIEVVWRGEHVNVLDADRFYKGLLNGTLRDIDEQALQLASSIPNNEPVLIETLPGNLSKMVAATGPGTAGVRAIEIVDGAPRGLGQVRRERARIVKLADSLNLALVAGSDHHGWGYTAAGWTLMRLPNWRAADSDALSRAISTVLRRGGRASTRVVERYVTDTESGLSLPFTLPLVTWGMMRTLSTDERIVWVMWALALYLLWRVRLFRRAPPVSPTR